MNFELDPELERIQKLARELAEDFATRASLNDQESTAPDENYAKLKQAGFYGLVAPKQCGCSGAGVLARASCGLVPMRCRSRKKNAELPLKA